MTLIVKTYYLYGWNTPEFLPYIEGHLPEFLVYPSQESFDTSEILVIGTNATKIDQFKAALDWYSPKTPEEVLTIAKDVDGYYQKSLSIQWFDTLLDRLDKNHIDFETGELLYRGKPVKPSQLGITSIWLESNGERMAVSELHPFSGRFTKPDEFCCTDGRRFIISDGQVEIYWDYDDHWHCGSWKKIDSESAN